MHIELTNTWWYIVVATPRGKQEQCHRLTERGLETGGINVARFRRCEERHRKSESLTLTSRQKEGERRVMMRQQLV